MQKSPNICNTVLPVHHVFLKIAILELIECCNSTTYRSVLCPWRARIQYKRSRTGNASQSSVHTQCFLATFCVSMKFTGGLYRANEITKQINNNRNKARPTILARLCDFFIIDPKA